MNRKMITNLHMNKLIYKFLNKHIMSMPSQTELTKPAFPITIVMLLDNTHSTQMTYESSTNSTSSHPINWQKSISFMQCCALHSLYKLTTEHTVWNNKNRTHIHTHTHTVRSRKAPEADHETINHQEVYCGTAEHFKAISSSSCQHKWTQLMYCASHRKPSP